MKTRTARLSLARLALLAAPAFVLFACPFASEWPLSDPAQASLDAALSGDWKVQDPESRQLVTVTFVPYNAREFVVFSRDAEDARGKVDAYRAFVTVIDGERFLNLQELGVNAAAEWSYASYRVEGEELTLRFIDDGLFRSRTFSSSDALREFVRGNLRTPGLYVSDSGQDSLMKFTKAVRP